MQIETRDRTMRMSKETLKKMKRIKLELDLNTLEEVLLKLLDSTNDPKIKDILEK